MNFDLTDDQRAIQRTAKEFLAARYKPEEVRRLALDDDRGFSDEQWTQLAELGWPALVVPEEDGGLGLGVVELAVVQEQLGYALAPSPFLSTVAAGLLLAAAGTAEQRARWLAPIATGEKRGALALVDDGPSELEPTGGSLSGTKIAVPDAGTADVLVIAASEGRHYLVERSAPGVSIDPARALDPSRKLFTVHLDGAEGHQLSGGDLGAVARAYDVLSVAVAAESVGVAQRTMEMAVESQPRCRSRRRLGRTSANEGFCHPDCGESR
jgi:alkylation response protein AidB-like acyl-CoA dehydrogenase